MKRFGIFILLFFLAFSSLKAQRVGVVFSGGGAKGLYHIGILKALEENQIPIDYIAGTSMGAIVSGLYAIGYNPDEIAQFFLSDQIKLWMSGRIESEYFFYFNRMQLRQEMIALNLDFKAEKNIAVLPTSLVPSTQIDMSFNEIFAPATAYAKGDFDQLFVPFRCVASDVYNKKEIVYREGDVGKAVRASMTIPMVFHPLKADSVLIYDGGIYNNFPWEPLEEDFQPDIFIGGKCVKGLQNPDETNIVEQIEAITMMHTDFNLPEGRSVLIDRVFDDVNMLDFSRAQYIMDVGYQDAMEKMDSIKARIPRRQNPEELHNRRLVFRSQLPELVFDDYRVSGLTDEQSHYVRRMLGLDDEKSNSFSFQEFKSAYFKILSEGEIIGEYPAVSYVDTTGFFTVNLSLRTKPSFRLKLGGNISSAALNQAYVGLEYKTIGRSAHSFRLDGNFSGLYSSLRGGWRTDFYLKSPVYFDLFVTYNDYNYKKGPNWGSFSKYGYNGYDDRFASASFGFPLGRSSAIQFRFNAGSDEFKYYERASPHREYGSPDRTEFDFYGVQFEASRRTLNYPIYPTRGTYQSISAIFVNGRERFMPGSNYIAYDEEGKPIRDEEGNILYGMNPYPEKATRRWFGARFMREEYFTVNKWLSFGYSVDAVWTNRPEFYTTRATNFISPGYTPTPYSQNLYMNKFRSEYYLGVGLLPIIEFADNFYLKNSLHLNLSDKMLESGLRLKDKIRHIFNMSLVYQTPVGPASLTVTNFEETSRKWFVVFNLGFTLFNKRGLFY
ncbi:patatin-like phospholipase family protein [Alistipes sp. OttesenSCG-928-L06]|nr:patatin-like phospholipase family protein [Alistipes sp. OttesenSCG-928-L06]